ncbi:2-octaprenyl-6-methoxyphenol hydroxylase [Klebsiella aerogenes]|nr:2-octaprenyl-6-methoxyphenol hydroxylase [Klebsiella aerogenes]
MSVLIVGGGMTGATLALAISRLTGGALPVHLIEAQDPHSSRHPGFDDRAIALAAGTCQQLARIGIWQRLAERATPIQRVHVSDRGHAGFVNLAAADYGLSALGQVVELHDVGQRLFWSAARGARRHAALSGESGSGQSQPGERQPYA